MTSEIFDSRGVNLQLPALLFHSRDEEGVKRAAAHCQGEAPPCQQLGPSSPSSHLELLRDRRDMVINK